LAGILTLWIYASRFRPLAAGADFIRKHCFSSAQGPKGCFSSSAGQSDEGTTPWVRHPQDNSPERAAQKNSQSLTSSALWLARITPVAGATTEMPARPILSRTKRHPLKTWINRSRARRCPRRTWKVEINRQKKALKTIRNLILSRSEIHWNSAIRATLFI